MVNDHVEITLESIHGLGLTGKNFLSEKDFTAGQLQSLIDLARALKSAKKRGREQQFLRGKNLGAIFEKTSTRTRISFAVAMADQGGAIAFLDSATSQIGHKESPADTARVLSRIFDGIEYRGSDHQVLEEFTQHASVPVFNGLTDSWHPTQMLADFLTMQEHRSDSSAQLSYCFLGDCRFNMANSLLITGAIMGADVRLVAPKSMWPDSHVIDLAHSFAADSGAIITITEDLEEGVRGAEFVHTDIWVSMGEPADVWEQRIAALLPYQVNAEVMALAGPTSKFMHCLPAYHDTHTTIGAQLADQFGLASGVEVTDEVFESDASIVFDQAENRMHSIKALLVATLA